MMLIPKLEPIRMRTDFASWQATELFAKQGFYKTTIKDIASKAGFSYGVVYLYVKEKEDVLLLVLQQVVNAYAEEIPKAMEGIEDPLDRLVRAIRAYCRVVDRHRAATAKIVMAITIPRKL